MLTKNKPETSWTLASPWPEELAHWHAPAKCQVKEGPWRTRWRDRTHGKKPDDRNDHGGGKRFPEEPTARIVLKETWPTHSATELLSLLTYTVVIQMGRKDSQKTVRWTKSPTTVEPDPPPWNQEQTSVKVNSMRTGLSRSGLALLSDMSLWYLGTNPSLLLHMQQHT